QLALAFRDWPKLNRAVNLRHDGSFRWLASFEEFDDTRQTARDVFGLRGFTRNLGDDVAGFHAIAVSYHQISANRHLVSLQNLVAAVPDFQTRLFLLVRRIF